MKNILFIFTMLVAPFSFAEDQKTQEPQPLFADLSSGVNNISLQVIPYAKDVGFGLAYEKSFRPGLALAAAFTYLPENNNALSHPAAGLLSLAAQIRLHQPIECFDFYMAHGFNVMRMEFLNNDDTSIGASFAFGSLVQFSKQLAVGIEFSLTTPWFSDDFYTISRGYFVNSAVTGRFTF